MDVNRFDFDSEIPLCRFGPGGDFIRTWPPCEKAAPAPVVAAEENNLTRLIGLIGHLMGLPVDGPADRESVPAAMAAKKTESTAKSNMHKEKTQDGGSSPDHSQTIRRTGSTRKAGSQILLFGDDRRIGQCAGHKPSYRVRASRRPARKKAGASPPGKGTLFEINRSGQTASLHGSPPESETLGFASSSLPLAGMVCAGYGIDTFENTEPFRLDDLFGNSGDLFVLQVKGRSMIGAGIEDGDYVICRRASVAENGQLVIAILEDGAAMLKRFYREPDCVCLMPANDASSPSIPPVPHPAVVTASSRRPQKLGTVTRFVPFCAGGRQAATGLISVFPVISA